jgi:hypothetical protein
MSIYNVLKAYTAIPLMLFMTLPVFAEENNGQDITRPLTRFDVRALYADSISVAPNDDNANSLTMLGRIDKPMPLKSGWVFYYRTDLPFTYNDVPSRDNVARDHEIGMGDWFHQAVMISPGNKKYPLGMQVWAYGMQLNMDTASEDHFGAGKWSLTPILAAKWQLSKNIDFIPVFKYRKSIGGDSHRADVEEFQFKPIVNISLPNKWFISFYDTADIRLQLSDDSRFEDDWSVPIDVMVGKASSNCFFTDKCVYSINAITNMVDDFETNDWTVQARVGLFF